MTADDRPIGRVTRCSTRGFVGAVRLPEPQWPVFGTFCRAEAQQGQSQVIGLIYDLSIEDDELARLLTFPNVLITAHQAFLTHEALSEIARVTVENITAFGKGQALLPGTALT